MVRTSAMIAIALVIFISPFASVAQGTGNSGGAGAATAPGTNSAGAAQSSDSNIPLGATTGSAGPLGTGTAPVTTTGSDTAINAENKTINKQLNGICKGC
jgi:hypothetical protein